jgi:glycerol-3-phosphate O-acyltransferase
VALVATALLEAGDTALSALDLKGRVVDLMSRLTARGAHIHVPRADQDYAVEVGLRMLRLRRLVDETDRLYRVDPANAVLLRYYANSIAHLLTSA